jgi:hypothetical protein
MKVFFIPGNVPSSKNSRNIVSYKDKVTGDKKTLSIASATVQKYRGNTKWLWAANKKPFLEATKDMKMPLYIGFYFLRNSKRKWDLVNPEQTVQDEMVKHKWIPEDDVHHLCPCPLFINGEYWRISTKHPGVIIAVFDNIEQIGQSHDGRDILKNVVRKEDLKYFKNEFNR